MVLIGLLSSVSVGADGVDWAVLLSSAWSRSQEGAQARAGKEVAGYSFELSKMSHLPQAAVESPNLVTWTRTGTGTVAQDSGAASLGLVVRQMLPGEGTLQVTLAHRLEKTLTTEAYRQTPSVEIRAAQPLGAGLFDWQKDPVWLLAQSESSRSQLAYDKARAEMTRVSLDLVQRWHLARRDRDYRRSVWEAERLRKDLNDRLFEKKMLAENVKWKSDRAFASAQSELGKAAFLERNRLLDWVRVFGEQPPEIESDDLDTLLRASSQGEAGADTEIALLNQDRTAVILEAEREKTARAPSVSLGVSLQPNAVSHVFASDWNTSWDDLSHKPALWDISASLGVTIPIEYSGEAELRKSAVRARVAAKDHEIADTTERHRDQLIQFRGKIKEFSDYLSVLKKQLTSGVKLLADTRALVDKGVLTEADAWDQEAELAKMKKDHDEVLWEVIQAQVEIAILHNEPLFSFP